jgi:hypothetical protein
MSVLGLRRELKQYLRDIQNLPYPPSPKMKTFYPLREVSTGGGNFGFVVSLLTSTEV